MQSTFELSPGWRSSLPWLRRTGMDLHADVLTAYYAGWFLDHATAGPRTIKEGRKEQQFPPETIKAACAWFSENTEEAYAAARAGNTDSAVDVVFFYEHFSLFEEANRVWPPFRRTTYTV